MCEIFIITLNAQSVIRVFLAKASTAYILYMPGLDVKSCFNFNY